MTCLAAMASEVDRERIYRLRHEVYARELHQHPENRLGALRDPLDESNVYLTVKHRGEIAGYISITPPTAGRYSIEKYISREDLPFALDEGVYEVRLLTVLQPHRGRQIAGLLMYMALRWVEGRGGKRIIAMGRREVVRLYRKVGLRTLGVPIVSGSVRYELMEAQVSDLRAHLRSYSRMLERARDSVDWHLDIPFEKSAACFHGGQFFKAVGEDFDDLQHKDSIINADVLDAWFDPSPRVIESLQVFLPWLIRTSPPTHCDGMVRAIARARGVEPENILPGAGSSDLIFLALRHWLDQRSRTLILDPTYGEYAHVLEKVIGCRVDRLTLSRGDGYVVDPDRLGAVLEAGYDLVVLVNPNSPTGRHVPRDVLERVLREAPPRTRFWIDETYVDYVGADQSLETFAARHRNVVVCKSMSKVYALSGLRAAYLCGSSELIQPLRALTPPWAVSLPAQVAAVRALEDPAYYARQYQQTHALREGLAGRLMELDLECIPGCANFILAHLPGHFPDAATVVKRCQSHGLFIRDASQMGQTLGDRAIRIAVKDRARNDRMIDVLQQSLQK